MKLLNKINLTMLFAVDIVLIVIYMLTKWILGINHLALRNIVNYSVYVAFAIISLTIAVQVIYILFKRVRQKENSSSTRIFSGIGIATIIAIIAFSSLNIFIRGVFGHQPEHVVERDGMILLARVDSFLQVEVRYYDHVNALVRSNNILIYEDFGNGGYDPFTLDKMPKVQRYMYFDENGKTIESNWTDSYCP